MFYPPLPSEFLEDPKEHVSAKKIPIQIIVFENDVLGVLLLTRQSMNIYYRVTQNLIATNYQDI